MVTRKRKILTVTLQSILAQVHLLLLKMGKRLNAPIYSRSGSRSILKKKWVNDKSFSVSRVYLVQTELCQLLVDEGSAQRGDLVPV